MPTYVFKPIEPRQDRNSPRPLAPAADSMSAATADMMTEQEKDAQAGGAATDGNVPGVGPATASEEAVVGETIEEQGIGPRTPYPSGDPAPPDESVTRFQGIKTAKPPHNEPNKPMAKERR
jgi:hypothetical protein